MKKLKELFKEHRLFLSFWVIYSFILTYPVIVKISRGEFFGGDIGQYLISAYKVIYGKETIFYYPYPVLPLIYVPIVALFKDPMAQYAVGCFLGPLILMFLTMSTYFSIKALVKDEKYGNAASLLGSIPVAFYSLYLDAIGWAGQAQLIALIFGMLMVKFYVERKFKHFVATSTVLVLTHPWTYAYFSSIIVLTSTILMIQSFIRQKRNNVGKDVISPDFIRFVLFPIALLNVAYMIFERGGVEALNKTPVVLAILNGDLDLDVLFKRMIYASEILYLVVLFSLLLISLAKMKFSNRKNRNEADDSHIVLLTTLTTTMTIVFILVSPAQYADRGLYLLPIPISFYASRQLAVLLGSAGEEFNSSCGDKTFGKFSLALIFAILLGCFSGVSLSLYPQALNYYSIPRELFEMPRVLGDVDGRVLLITPHALWFPTSGILKADVLTTSQPVWFIQDNQIYFVELANLLAWGNKIARCGKIAVVDSEPLYPQPSVAVFISDYPYFVELFRLSDSLLTIQWSPKDSREEVLINSHYHADKITSEWGIDSSYAYITNTYEWNSLIVNKTTYLYNNSRVKIRLTYDFINSTPFSIDHDLIFLVMKDLGKNLFIDFAYINDSNVVVTVTQYFKEPYLYKQFVTYFTINSESAIIEHLGQESMKTWSSLKIRYKPSSGNTSFIAIDIEINTSQSMIHGYCNLELIGREYLIQYLDIRYVVVDREFHDDVLNLIERDPTFYEYAEIGKFVIYRRK